MLTTLYLSSAKIRIMIKDSIKIINIIPRNRLNVNKRSPFFLFLYKELALNYNLKCLIDYLCKTNLRTLYAYEKRENGSIRTLPRYSGRIA